MTQTDQDRWVTLKKAKTKLITQRQSAEELGLSTRQVKCFLKALKKRARPGGDTRAAGQASNNRTAEQIRHEAVAILSLDVHRGFGATLASEYLDMKQGIEISRETARTWMRAAGLWRSQKLRVEQAHLFRPPLSPCEELLQCDTSEYDWLAGRGGTRYLIAMIDDATNRLEARFVASDWTWENLRSLWQYVERYGRLLAFCTGNAGLFRTAPKTQRKDTDLCRDERDPLPPTQIGRALRELDIAWIPAHSPQAKGPVEKSLQTVQDRFVKGLRVSGCAR